MTKYQTVLASIFGIVWVAAAINPLHRDGWLLENVLVLAFIPVVIITARYFKLSDVSYTLITIFLILHVIGSHWTYGDVPFGFWLQDLLGATRNMYDRLVHFSFGLLLAYPIREVFMRVTDGKGFWAYYFPFDVVLSLSAVYELAEWLIATTLVGEKLGLAFLGVQGDIWDAQKDMGLAALGSLIAMFAVLFFNWWFNEDLKEEMKESFRIKKEEPMGGKGFRQLIR